VKTDAVTSALAAAAGANARECRKNDRRRQLETQDHAAVLSFMLQTAARLERDDFSLNRHPALASCLSMIFFRKPLHTFRDHALGGRPFVRDPLTE
jgi:hypothetical protein